MPLGRGIVEVFEAIPDRIEVDGHAPTWRVTGGSFASVLRFAAEAFGETTVVAREDRARWWPRVTLTLTTDPALAAAAPPPETCAAPPQPEPAPPQEAQQEARREPPPEPPAQRGADRPQPQEEPAAEDDAWAGLDAEDERWLDSPLEHIFAYQEAVRLARRRGVPEQRSAPD